MAIFKSYVKLPEGNFMTERGGLSLHHSPDILGSGSLALIWMPLPDVKKSATLFRAHGTHGFPIRDMSRWKSAKDVP